MHSGGAKPAIFHITRSAELTASNTGYSDLATKSSRWGRRSPHGPTAGAQFPVVGAAGSPTFPWPKDWSSIKAVALGTRDASSHAGAPPAPRPRPSEADGLKICKSARQTARWCHATTWLRTSPSGLHPTGAPPARKGNASIEDIIAPVLERHAWRVSDTGDPTSPRGETGME